MKNERNFNLMQAGNDRGANSEQIIETILGKLLEEGVIEGFNKCPLTEDLLEKKDFRVYFKGKESIFLQIKSGYDKCQQARLHLSANKFIVCVQANQNMDQLIIKNSLEKALEEMQLYLTLNDVLKNLARHNKIFFYHRLARNLMVDTNGSWLGAIVSLGFFNFAVYLVPANFKLIHGSSFTDIRDAQYLDLPLLLLNQNNYQLSNGVHQAMEKKIVDFISRENLKRNFSQSAISHRISESFIRVLEELVSSEKGLQEIIHQAANRIKKNKRKNKSPRN